MARARQFLLVHAALFAGAGALLASGRPLWAACACGAGALSLAVRALEKPPVERRPRVFEPETPRMLFLTNVSHELRTPLSAIRGFLKLLEERLYEDEAERQEFYESSRFAVAHMLHVIDDSLQAARLDRRSLVPDRETVAGADAAMQVLRMLDALGREKDLALRVAASGRGLVRADAVLLRQILINLVGNAIKFTDEGSVTVRIAERGAFVRFDVEDTGAGIEPAALEAIFERFHQADPAASRAKGGIGLGLALSRQMVELMGGHMEAQSDGRGRGARLSFTLPAAVEPAAVS